MLEQNETRKNILFYTVLLIIVAVSYSFYSFSNYPLLSSDDGLNVLMAHYYDFPQDMYCWGQDRGGTLVPMVSQLWIKGFGMSAIDAVSVTTYIILILGYIGFASLLKKRSSRILLALIWFLPFQRFVDLTRFPIGSQYSLIGFSIFLMLRLHFKDKPFLYWKNHLLLAVITGLLGLSIWMSDLAAISITILLFSLLIIHYKRHKTLVFRKEVLLYLFGGIVFWTLFILKAKSYATHKTEQFATINSFQEMLQGLSIMKQAFADVLFFRERDYLTSIYAWLTPVLLIVLLVNVFRRRVEIAPERQPFFCYLVLDFAGILGVILLSHWVLINQMGRWYFVATYVSVSMISLILLENLVTTAPKKKLFYGFMFLVVLIGSGSTFYNMRFVSAKTLRPAADLSGEFLKLGKAGIIAEYWNAYRASCPNPDMIKATPHDKSDVRKQLIVDEVFAQPKLYVIRDIWMDHFPDTLQQFGFTIVRSGKPFFLGGCNICRYKRLSLTKTFRLPELKADPAFIVKEGNDSVVRVTPKMENAKGKHIVYGPHISLLPGKYTVRYHLKMTPVQRMYQLFGGIDISADYGQTPLLYQKVYNPVKEGEYEYIDAELNIPRRLNNVEFRFLYSGNKGNVEIDKIELIER
jgi:hypothetical protein